MEMELEDEASANAEKNCYGIFLETSHQSIYPVSIIHTRKIKVLVTVIHSQVSSKHMGRDHACK